MPIMVMYTDTSVKMYSSTAVIINHQNQTQRHKCVFEAITRKACAAKKLHASPRPLLYEFSCFG